LVNVLAGNEWPVKRQRTFNGHGFTSLECTKGQGANRRRIVGEPGNHVKTIFGNRGPSLIRVGDNR
jgi:hypothetical protein